MAVRQPKRPTTSAERSQADRVARGRPPRSDVDGSCHEALAALADEYRCDVGELVELWDERRQTRLYDGAAVADAEAAAVDDVRAIVVLRHSVVERPR
jgi:hypothetical protein